MKKKLILLVILLALAGTAWWFRAEIRARLNPSDHELVLYGNVDDRRLKLSFMISERIAELLPEEGTVVKKGDLIGSLESVRIENDIVAVKADIAARRAAVAASQAAYDKAKNGSRPEDIAIAHGGHAAIQARIKASESDFRRQQALAKDKIVSAQTAELAEAEYFFYKGGLTAIQNYLAKVLAGERVEDIAAAAAKLDQAKAEQAKAEAELVIKEQTLKDTRLYAPCDGIIRNRLLEPGEMTNPQTAVFTLAVVSPKWIRCYLKESWLTKVKSGDKTIIRFDGAKSDFEGWIGFISPVAEFTPKNIETPELRTSLVYETRVFVNDPENVLKLGAPATVIFPGVMVK